MSKSNCHGRKDSSDELDVFEASRYFAGGGYNESAQPWRSSGGRMSLDFVAVPDRQAHITGGKLEKRTIMKENKYKQPHSPGTRLASFLNSLFNQTKKKKSKSIIKDEGEKERRRRSSISHFGTSNTRIDTDYTTKSVFSYSGPGYRTPPVNAHTSTKSFYKQSPKPTATGFQFQNGGIWVEGYGYSSTNKVMKKGNKVVDDDGYDSDSSSDLFELQNYDLGVYSSSGRGSLPVYETTRIRRGGISSAASAL